MKRERNCQENLLDMNFDSNYQIAISYNLHVADLYAKSGEREIAGLNTGLNSFHNKYNSSENFDSHQLQNLRVHVPHYNFLYPSVRYTLKKTIPE